ALQALAPGSRHDADAGEVPEVHADGLGVQEGHGVLAIVHHPGQAVFAPRGQWVGREGQGVQGGEDVRVVLDRNAPGLHRGHPVSKAARSSARRMTRPFSSRPRALTHRENSAAAPQQSPAFSLRTSVEPQKAEFPTLNVKLTRASYCTWVTGTLTQR